MQLANKLVVLTGASGGIGQAFAKALCAQGARLLLIGRNEAKLDAVIQQLPKGSVCQPLVADLTSQSGRQRVVDAAAALGGCDVLINNAGVSDFSLIAEQDFTALLEINLLSPMLLSQQLLAQLQAKPSALLINIGSAFGSIGHAGYTGYCASKFGLRGFTEALKRELADSAVQVLYLAPRATDTDLNSSAVQAMNQALGNTADSPERVAGELLAQINQAQSRRYIGFPEKLFIRVNALWPSIVDKALQGKLALIKQFARQPNQ